MTVSLRAMRPADLPLVLSGGTEFSHGPDRVETQVSPSSLDEPGRLLVVDEQDRVLGVVSWIWNQWGPTAASRCVMIGIWLSPDARGRGAGAAAQQALVDLIFRHTATHRVEAHTEVENVAEHRALNRIGFTREGIVRGAHRDGYLYSLLRPEWSAARP